MMSRYFGILRLSLVGGLACTAISPAHAAQEIVLVSDQTQIVNLAEAPSTVVVGNPAVADVTTEGRMLFFHPRGYGVTNVIALDADGRKLGDYTVSIVYDDTNVASIYSPSGRETFNCRKDCETTMRIGDAGDYFGTYKTQAEDKNTLARTQAMGEDASSSNQQTVTNTVFAPR